MYHKNYFNFAKFNNKYLITNDFGNYAFVSNNVFNKLLNNEKLPTRIFEELINKQFIYMDDDNYFLSNHYMKLKEYKDYLDVSTVLHIFVVSKNCNYNCIYCQAGNLNQNEQLVMDEEIAKKAVNIALESPSEYITFEFQGGEPLTNFEIIKFIVNYSKIKNNELDNRKKKIEYILVSNLSLLTDEMVDFICENNILVCTSIDGDRNLQNKNRIYSGYDSYEATVNGIKKLRKVGVNVSSILTTTKYSLKDYRSVVNEYVKLKLSYITLRSLTRLGKAKNNWNEISYSADEFITFYKKALKYIIQLNKQGTFLVEGYAKIFLSKILKGKSINHMELRSPCGGAIGQLAYYYDGNIFTCDEGRMLAEMGDNKFLLGNVFENNYKDLMKSECSKSLCKSSCLETHPCCHSCVYMPYCGMCPVINYANSGDMLKLSKSDFNCKIMHGILDTLFYYIKNDKSVLKIFESWL